MRQVFVIAENEHQARRSTIAFADVNKAMAMIEALAEDGHPDIDKLQLFFVTAYHDGTKHVQWCEVCLDVTRDRWQLLSINNM